MTSPATAAARSRRLARPAPRIAIAALEEVGDDVVSAEVEHLRARVRGRDEPHRAAGEIERQGAQRRHSLARPVAFARQQVDARDAE